MRTATPVPTPRLYPTPTGPPIDVGRTRPEIPSCRRPHGRAATQRTGPLTNRPKDPLRREPRHTAWWPWLVQMGPLGQRGSGSVGEPPTTSTRGVPGQAWNPLSPPSTGRASLADPGATASWLTTRSRERGWAHLTRPAHAGDRPRRTHRRAGRASADQVRGQSAPPRAGPVQFARLEGASHAGDPEVLSRRDGHPAERDQGLLDLAGRVVERDHRLGM